MQIRSRSVREEVNDHTHRLHAEHGAAAGEFLGECGHEECRSFVWLTLREFEGLRSSRSPVLAHRDDAERLRLHPAA
jgi:hypothetical protein